EWKSVALVTLIVVGGRIFAGALGSAVSGQSIEDCTRISLSKAQIGEFSFIIATLGLSSGALNAEVFPVIVATSVLTIFTTPYFIKYSDLISAKMLTTIPPRGQQAYERYCTWLERKMTSSSGGPSAYRDLARWFSCSIILITIFEGIATFLLKALQERFTTFGSLIAWIIAILASMPFIWAIVFPTKPPTSHQQHKFSRRLSLVGATLTVLLIGVLSREFFSFLDALVLTILLVFGLLIVSRKHLEVRYRWIEGQFLSGFSSPSDEKPHGKERVTKKILGPWNAHLQEVAVPSGSEFGGLTLADLQIREKYGVNIICIERNDQLFAEFF
ncbi:MAG: cation:proton antiporter, partial [Proteobacteria bacterium]|nr:cation:proton antiporter [Pseudomonadota bacterium]